MRLGVPLGFSSFAGGGGGVCTLCALYAYIYSPVYSWITRRVVSGQHSNHARAPVCHRFGARAVRRRSCARWWVFVVVDGGVVVSALAVAVVGVGVVGPRGRLPA